MSGSYEARQGDMRASGSYSYEMGAAPAPQCNCPAGPPGPPGNSHQLLNLNDETAVRSGVEICLLNP